MIRRFLATLLLTTALAAGADPISDDRLFDQVRIRIAQDREIGADKITVKVEGGVVELTGTVQLEKHRDKAEKLAKKVKGVKSVQNKLQVSPV